MRQRFCMKKLTFAPLSFFAILSFLTLIAPIPAAKAGVFTIPNYINKDKVAFGLEPEWTLSHENGLALNARFQYGLSELSNLHLLAGTGSGQRQFRLGGAVTFDFFPDSGEQPGMGIATSGIYYRNFGEIGSLELTAIPYIHKAFVDKNGYTIEPFFALPFGEAFYSSVHQFIVSAVGGVRFYPDAKSSPISFIGEVSLSVKDTENSISGGIVYAPF